jgi:hypothetical protein
MTDAHELREALKNLSTAALAIIRYNNDTKGCQCYGCQLIEQLRAAELRTSKLLARTTQ